MKASEFKDPFEDARIKDGIYEMNDQGEHVAMVLRLKDVRKCAHKWQIFNSGGAKPGRIVIPSEEHIRDIRQIPVETDPPIHQVYRKILDPWFKRPLGEAYQKRLNEIINDVVEASCQQDGIEVVEEFALKLQSHALTVLLNVPFEEAATWISWGTHVFRSPGNDLDDKKAGQLDRYIATQIDKAIQQPGEDLYSVLLSTEIEGRKLSREEVHGVINLTFAGGRDTVINAITNSIVYFAENPAVLKQIHQNPELINSAVEELIRYFTPLTHLGRIAIQETQICEHAVKANDKISLCWASANRDANAFENPNEVHIDRKINPHVSFGFGRHQCLGATHARQLLRTLMAILAANISSIDLLDYEENIEEWNGLHRKVGFNWVKVKFNS